MQLQLPERSAKGALTISCSGRSQDHPQKGTEQTFTTSDNLDPSESYMLDMERNKILKSLSNKFSSGDSVCSRSSHGGRRRIQDFKWPFTALILLLGAAASATVFWVGIRGVHKDSEQAFLHEASQLASVMDFSWRGYETLALWIHESCHFNAFSVDPHMVGHVEEANTSSTSLSSVQGFCSRTKFRHLYEHIQSTNQKFVAIQYIPNVTHSLRQQVEEESKLFLQQHKPDFPYSGLRDYLAYPNATFKGIVPSPERPFYFPIHYLEPIDRNEPALDLDMYSFRQDEIDTAMATLQPVLGARGVLLQENTTGIYAVSLIHPGYPTSLTGDLASTDAVTKIVIRMPDIIEQAAAATKSTPHTVYIFDQTPKRTATNDGKPVFLAAAEILGTPDINGTHTRTLPELELKDIPKATHSFETTLRAADHSWRIVIHGAEPQHDIFYVALGGVIILLGCLILALAFLSNLHRVAKMQQIQSKAEAEKAELALLQAKRETHLNDFIAHEVRNPLSSAIAALSFVNATTQERVQDQETKKALLDDLQILDSSLQYINDLLRNMLDIHRTASKKMKLDENATDVLKDIFEPVQSILCVKQNKARILIDCPDNLIVVLDRLRVKQIILNLAINSTKFVQDGFIRLRAEVEDHTSNVVLYVEDSGPGIRPEQRDRLFNKFQESFDLLSQGTGIGLHICKSLSELMGADLYLDDDYHSEFRADCPGARFVVDLHRTPEVFFPLDIPQPNGESDQHHADSSALDLEHASPQPLQLPDSLSVLFVDDDFILRKLFKRTIKRAAPAWRVEEASNGETALSLAVENQYDLIFIDQYMASVEKQLLGSETVRAMRQKGVSSTLVGLSANDLKDHFLECGADAFMLKPFPCESEKLQRELQQVLRAGAINNHYGLDNSNNV